jgi:hypothetical protein
MWLETLGASISNAFRLISPGAFVSASTASSSTAGTDCSSCEPCGWNIRDAFELSV